MPFVLAVLIASVCFGTTGTARALGPDADPVSVGAARILIGGGALALIALVQQLVRRRQARAARASGTDGAPSLRGGAPSDAEPRARRLPTWAILLLGAAGVVGYQPAFFAGTTVNGVAVGTVVALGSAPVLTGALGWLLGGRFPGGRWTAATAIATAGVAILALAADPAHAGASPLGLTASLGAGLSYAVYTLAGKALIDRGWSSTGSMAALFGTAAIGCAALLTTTDAGWLVTWPGIGMALWLGLATTTVAYVLFGYGLTGLAPTTVSTLTLAEPLTASVLAALVLGERLSAGALVGLAVLAAGIVLLAAQRRPAPAMSEGADTVGAWTSSSSLDSGSTPPRGSR